MQYGLFPGVYLDSGYTFSSGFDGSYSSSGASSTDPIMFLSSSGYGSANPTVQNRLIKKFAILSSTISYRYGVKKSLAIYEFSSVSSDIEVISVCLIYF